MQNKNIILHNIEYYANMMLEKAEHNMEAARNLWYENACNEDVLLQIECFSECVAEYRKTLDLKNIFEQLVDEHESKNDLEKIDLDDIDLDLE